MKKVQLSIIIVSWNTKEALKDCLDSIKKFPPSMSFEVNVIDNASVDGTVDLVCKKFPWVQLILNKENLGFAKANNQVLRETKSDYVLILNSDTVLAKNSVNLLFNFLQANKSVGACGPLLLNPDGSLQESGYYRKFPSLIQGLLFYTQLDSVSRKSKFLKEKYWETRLDKERITEVDQIPGACILATKIVLEEVGFFNEDYPLWFEDVDLCFKLKQAGFKLFLVPESRVTHLGGTSFSKWNEEVKKQTRFYKSMFIYFDKHTNLMSRFLIRIIILLNLLYLIITKEFKQLITPTSDRKIFINQRMELIKCLLA